MSHPQPALLATCFAVILTLASNLPAQTPRPDDPTAAQYFAVATARTRAELALRGAQQFYDENKSVPAVIGDALEAARSGALAVIERAQSNEQHKPEADRSEEVSEDLTRRSRGISERWQRLYGVERPAISAHYESASASLTSIAIVLTGVTAIEQQWKELEMDLGPVEHAYQEVARRAHLARERGAQALAELKQKREEWESMSRSTVTAVGPRAGQRPSGVPSGL